MIDLTAWQEYLNLLNRLADTLDQLTGIERAKTAAVGKGDLPGVEECMKKEQVMSLSLRGMDQKRDKLLARLGLSGLRLRDLEAHSPAELRTETKKTAERLRQKYDVFRSAADVARDSLEANLHVIEQLQNAQNAPPPDTGEHQADFLA